MKDTYEFPHLDARQTISRLPSEWESDLADAIENAFGKGLHELPDLVAALNASRVRPPQGGRWTEEGFAALMHELGA